MISIDTIHKKLIQDLGSIQDKSILDYGCGRGGLIKLLLVQKDYPKFIYAVDVDANAIKNIEEVYSDKIKQGLIGTQVIDNPSQLLDKKFDKIICHNVIECITNKEKFVNDLYKTLNENGILIISHHDFDSAIYNTSYKDLTRQLIHFFADEGESWQTICDGQIGRKLPGIFKRTGIENISFETWRIVETTFKKEDYSYLMTKMILEVAKDKFDQASLNAWMKDLELKAQANDFYFAIDVVIGKAIKTS